MCKMHKGVFGDVVRILYIDTSRFLFHSTIRGSALTVFTPMRPDGHSKESATILGREHLWGV